MLAATDLVSLIGEHVTLRKKGREHVGLCPFHDDRSPSMHVVSHKGTPFFKCFACGESGGAIDFVMKYHKMDFREALRLLADRAGIELTQRAQPETAGPDAPTRGDLMQANAFAEQFFRNVLAHPQAGAAARQVASKRGLDQTTIETFGIGAAPTDWEGLLKLVRKRGYNQRAYHEAGLLKERGSGLRDAFVNRLMFPICDQMGRPIAFGGRVIDPEDQPKYLNSAESAVFQKSRTLYGLHLAQRAIQQHNLAIVCEGYMDVVALHQAGFTHAVATLGTALSEDHARLLTRLCDRVVLLFDGDEAGQKAADRAVEVFFSHPVDVRIAILPQGQDPDDLVRQGDAGRAVLQQVIDGAVEALTFLIDRFRVVLARAEGGAGRQKRLEEFGQRLADLGYWSMSGVRKGPVLLTLAHLFRVPADEVEKHVPRRRARPATHVESKSAPGDNGSTTHDPAADLFAERAPRARRVAEEDVLSVLVFQPELALSTVDVGDGHLLPLCEAFQPQAFQDAPCRTVFEAIFEHAESGVAPDVAGLQAHLAGAGLERYVTDLYARGRDLCGDDESRAHARLNAAVRGLDQLRDRETLRRRAEALRGSSGEPTADVPAFVRLLEERRAIGDDRAVLPRSVRSG
ncbi:MAG: DNA primase [Phycisphaeraceae bacterium]|nr:DNA primase [Phycisphaerales bacterium]QOJ17455.1 MAG: DNA primase [Phycisphaeraceae bacterium]